MMIVTGKQMKEIDRTAIEEFKVPGLKLMETAGEKVYEVILKEISGLNDPQVTILCGAGNNGGDGYVAARKLHCDFVKVKVYSTVDTEKLTGDAKVNYLRLTELGIAAERIEKINFEKFSDDIINSEVILDAVLGTGISREIDDELKNILEFVNKYGRKIISADIPSGIGADDGKVYGAAVKAHKTVTFQLPKLGCVIYPGADYTGELIVKDIGIPSEVLEAKASGCFLIDEACIKSAIKPRSKDIHKGTCGKVLIVAGSEGMAGAAVLSAKAALRSGAGLVKAAVPEKLNDIIQISVPEAVCIPLGDKEHDKIYKAAAESDAVVIGPGIGKSENTIHIIQKIIDECEIPVVIDADGINALKGRQEILKGAAAKVVLTPHPGEMARLIDLDAKQVNENRIGLALKYADEWKTAIVLKGAATVVAFPDKTVYVNTSGNPGMATGGSGDVLSGIIASLAAQGIEFKSAVQAGVYLHGRAGDIMAEKTGEYGLIASDLAMGAALAIKEMVQGAGDR